MTTTPPTIVSSDHTLQPGGRWERLLTACATECLTIGDLRRATDPGQHPRRVEKERIFRALITMARAGLVESVGDWGWTATAEGRDALTALDLARAQAVSLREASDSAQTRAQAARDRVPSDSAQKCRAA